MLRVETGELWLVDTNNTDLWLADRFAPGQCSEAGEVYRLPPAGCGWQHSLHHLEQVWQVVRSLHWLQLQWWPGISFTLIGQHLIIFIGRMLFSDWSTLNNIYWLNANLWLVDPIEYWSVIGCQGELLVWLRLGEWDNLDTQESVHLSLVVTQYKTSADQNHLNACQTRQQWIRREYFCDGR